MLLTLLKKHFIPEITSIILDYAYMKAIICGCGHMAYFDDFNNGMVCGKCEKYTDLTGTNKLKEIIKVCEMRHKLAIPKTRIKKMSVDINEAKKAHQEYLDSLKVKKNPNAGNIIQQTVVKKQEINNFDQMMKEYEKDLAPQKPPANLTEEQKKFLKLNEKSAKNEKKQQKKVDVDKYFADYYNQSNDYKNL